MKLTIIPIDDAVYVDGVFKGALNLSQFNIPDNVHALQWYDTKGWLEFNDSPDPFTPKPANEIISELPQWALDSYQAWVDASIPSIEVWSN
jgi:hypothetical protein